eukprot:Clim_evm36s34 gene=Clim_evmTU36s34
MSESSSIGSTETPGNTSHKVNGMVKLVHGKYFTRIQDVPLWHLRVRAVVKRLKELCDSPRKLSLFAWGRMTITIKDSGKTVELWKPKRREIIAVFAHIHINRARFFKGHPDYEYVYEDASTREVNTPYCTLRELKNCFVSLQRELDMHWGVHKRTLCPTLRKTITIDDLKREEYSMRYLCSHAEAMKNPFATLEGLAKLATLSSVKTFSTGEVNSFFGDETKKDVPSKPKASKLERQQQQNGVSTMANSPGMNMPQHVQAEYYAHPVHQSPHMSQYYQASPYTEEASPSPYQAPVDPHYYPMPHGHQQFLLPPSAHAPEWQAQAPQAH